MADYPIRIEGENRGTLTVLREGLTTRFEARCADPGRLLRLSVYGGGKEGYLGVMAPDRGALTLSRRLTKTALAGFPESIEYAAEAGRAVAPPPESPPPRPESPSPGEKRGEKDTELLWYAVGDGSLYTVYAGRAYRAIPCPARALPVPGMVERRRIEGIDYAVFALEKGRMTE